MVSFNTVADTAVPFDNPQHLGFKHYLAAEAERLGLTTPIMATSW